MDPFDRDPRVRVAAITVSDTRTEGDDAGGACLRDRIEAAGFVVTLRAIVRDDPDEVHALVTRVCNDDIADAIITTGGTGIAPRDRTYEAMCALLDKRLDGFGEAFRRLSWDDIGPRAVLSRAVAGVHRGRVIAALPGSPRAVALGVDRILAPILPHAVALARGDRHGH
ncbi:MAG: molybdenum cofactor biosynthesis protein MoaB [Myxococcota bacterium]|nr:molybdenum cofactor biosynthesis protein MoaB [Myxococcota bacterium]